jgi:CubicO group peptidase (beta-lactamase class C family)
MTRWWGRDPFRTGLVQAVEDAAGEALAASTTPGLAVALVHQGRWPGRPATVWGPHDVAAGEHRTCFQAASLSKPVVAWGVLRLVESGRIGLDEPIVGHLRRWPPQPHRPMPTDGQTVYRLPPTTRSRCPAPQPQVAAAEWNCDAIPSVQHAAAPPHGTRSSLGRHDSASRQTNPKGAKRPLRESLAAARCRR